MTTFLVQFFAPVLPNCFEFFFTTSSKYKIIAFDPSYLAAFFHFIALIREEMQLYRKKQVKIEETRLVESPVT